MGLDEDPFDWRLTKDGRVLVSRGGRQILVVAGVRAAKLRSVLDGGDGEAIQQALARVTGNYRRGNERRSGRS